MEWIEWIEWIGVDWSGLEWIEWTDWIDGLNGLINITMWARLKPQTHVCTMPESVLFPVVEM